MTTATTPETETPTQADPAAASDLQQAAPARKAWLQWAVLAALAVAMLAQLWTSVVQLSVTSDEIDHLHAAYRYWQCNDFGWNPEHPPLVKIVAGLPLLFMHINDPIANACGAQNSKPVDFVAGRRFLFANPEKMLMAARFAVSLFPILLLLTVWFFARKAFGFPVAVIAGALTAFEPNFLAHGALVTTDVAAAVGMVLAVYALYNYVGEPNRTRLLATGLAVGFALGAKHSSILLAVIVPALLAVDTVLMGREHRHRRVVRYVGALLVVAGIGLTVLWAAYGFRFAARPGGAAVWTPPRIEKAHGILPTRVIPQLEKWRVAPQSYLAGLQDVLVRSETGVPSFIFGKIYHSGRWFYFPITMVVKYTLPLLAMLLASLLSWRFWRGKLRELLFLVTPTLIYLVFSSTSKLNIGSRHLLPVLPLLIIFASAGAWSLARTHKWGGMALVAALALHAISSLHASPHYLNYSNELWGGPANSYRYLAYSDADWGEAQKEARDYIAKTHPAECFILRTYNNRNSDYGIPCDGISEIQWDQLHTPYTGTMIVSSTLVDGVGLGGVDWETRRVFKDLQPAAKLGGSALLVYEGTFDLSPLVASQLLFEARKAGESDPRAALQYATQAATLDPSNGDAHVVMCGSYHAMDDMKRAQQECDIGLALISKDPKYNLDQVNSLKTFILGKGLKVEAGD